MNALNTRKRWSTVKTRVLGASSSLPPLIERRQAGPGHWIRRSPCFWLAHFDAKQCRDSFQQPHFCNTSLVLCSVAFRSSSIFSLLLGLNPYSGNDPDGRFPLFYKQVTQDLASKSFCGSSQY